MHILVTNDDGPPSALASPYILPFIQTLQAAGHTVSVILPDVQRSWIGKAHIIGQEIRTEAYWPPSSTPPTHTANSANTAVGGKVDHPWILVNSTPATCAQLGLNHFFTSRSPIDLVISGPNYGRNTTALFALSSGTLGAALEAAVCGSPAIALSFAFFDRVNLPQVVAETCAHAVRVCEALARRGEFGVGGLFSVNVPVKAGVGGRRVVWTRMLQNLWREGGCFREVESASQVGGPGVEEGRVRGDAEGGAVDGVDGVEASTSTSSASRQRHFKWAPRFTDVYESVEKAGPGSDGWAVQRGETSVTALRANFMHVEGLEGEVKL